MTDGPCGGMLTDNGVLAVPNAKGFNGQIHTSCLLLDCHGSGKFQHGSVVQGLSDCQVLIQQIILQKKLSSSKFFAFKGNADCRAGAVPGYQAQPDFEICEVKS